ncbi:hypothetical protein Pan153_31560 [Gimesia panareensis]|uniref:Uncharacterized protein n=1 Tax=Gimesia panareensis TaxID=2527978 RepID=A0A518FQ86_9PLAN|nr:hypothetical protein [Gimesia panareensis]QDV18498.1 hypothetical protein Pan153_31560 [Gimesia panareensis]
MDTIDQNLDDAINSDSIHIDEFERFCLLQGELRCYQNLDDSNIIIPDFVCVLRSAHRELTDFEPPVG